MRSSKLFTAIMAGALALVPIAVLADDEAPTAADDVLAQVQAIADESGVPVEEILGMQIPLEGDVPEGSVTTLAELVESLADKKIQDPSYTGIENTPQLNAGNLLHMFAAADAFIAPRTADPAASYKRYDVVESEYSPDTPIVPVPNPFLLAGPAAGVSDPVGLPLLLATHWGGKLKSVQYRGANLLSAHSAGTTLIGSNVDTAPREPAESDTLPVPFWAPLVHPGTLTMPDKTMDYVGFALVAQGASCSKTNIPFTQNAFYICVGAGLLLGDGVANFNGGPINLRSEVPVIWEPAVAPLPYDQVPALPELPAVPGTPDPTELP